MAARPTFSIEVAERDGVDVVTIAGIIDENADLTPLSELGVRPIEVNLRGVRRINSFGVRTWIDAVRRIAQSARLTFVQCPPPVVDQRPDLLRGQLCRRTPSGAAPAPTGTGPTTTSRPSAATTST